MYLILVTGGNGDYEIAVESTQYLEYVMSLIKQAIKD